MNNFRCVAYANVKKGLIFRSEGLFFATEKDFELFKSNNITTIVDLRSNKEQTEKPDPEINGIAHISLPLMKKREPGQKPKMVDVHGVFLPDMAELYRQIVAPDRKEVWAQIFNIILENDGVLFHCSEGKDRTGIVSAIILSALGVGKDLVFKDYLLTNESSLFKSVPNNYFEGSGLDEETKADIFNHFKAHQEYLEAVFDEIDRVYGLLDKFLIDCCALDDQKLSALKKKYLI